MAISIPLAASNIQPSIFSIDGHNLTVIEADGVTTSPVTVNQLTIFAAQRYSFVLEANQPVDNYWIRAQPDALSAVDSSFKNGMNSAILRYKGAPHQDPTSAAPAPEGVDVLDETALHPLVNPAAPGNPWAGGADVNLYLELSKPPGAPRFMINGQSYISPGVPVLLQILSGAHSAQELLPSGSVYTLPSNQVIEVTLNGGDAPGGPHPFHLHGVSNRYLTVCLLSDLIISSMPSALCKVQARASITQILFSVMSLRWQLVKTRKALYPDGLSEFNVLYSVP
jgi:iron transport multicopper oxidase